MYEKRFLNGDEKRRDVFNMFDEIYDFFPHVKKWIQSRIKGIQHVRGLAIETHLDFNLLKEKTEEARRSIFARVACLLLQALSSVSGILAFMREIIGHFLIFQNFFFFCLHCFSIICHENWREEVFRHLHLLSGRLWHFLIPELIINGISRKTTQIIYKISCMAVWKEIDSGFA